MPGQGEQRNGKTAGESLPCTAPENTDKALAAQEKSRAGGITSARASAGTVADGGNLDIVLSGLSKRFKGLDHPAVAPLELKLHAGAVTGLVGPDGAGKTTLLRMLAGLLAPSAGQARVAGLDPVAEGRALRAVLGYMPQRFGLYEDLSVQENLTLYASLRGVEGKERQASFATLLRFTGLEPFTGRLAGKLSGGMKQKLGLACALLGSPRVLLLDEPGVGVDPISRRELWAMVHALAGEGLLIVWSTSYLDEAEQCREVVLLREGALLYAGPPGNLTRSMAGRSFLADPGERSKRALLRQALGAPEVGDGIIQGGFVRLILRKDVAPEAVARALNLPAEALRPAEPRFEDAFIDLLGGGPSGGEALGGEVPAVSVASRQGKESAPVIEARELTRTFGSFTATDRVSFAVGRGEIFGLLGPNGAGKSTTFKMMCGLLKPSSGQALVLGRDLQREPAAARRRLGYMAQKFSLYEGLSVKQNLRFFSGIYGLSGREREKRIQEMTATFGFAPMLGQAAGELPLGFKQRLALACALMHRPDILFLDEPTSGVDPLTRREFWLHINSMVEKGVTVMVTTHFMDEAEYCDRIGLVYHGRLIAAGPPDSLKAEARAEQTPNPSMEEAFISLIERYDAARGEN